MDHTTYVVASYAVSLLTVAGLILWVTIDGRARRLELKALADAGIRRRSAPPPPAAAAGELP